jgi:hypothetical protein
MLRRSFAFLLPLILITSPASAFEVAEFKSGMAQNEVKTQLIANWNFDRIVEPSDDVILAYDNDPSIARRYQFRFCKGKLVGFEQDVRPSLKSLIITDYLLFYKPNIPIAVSRGQGQQPQRWATASSRRWTMRKCSTFRLP